jgi:hypothetical protein
MPRVSNEVRGPGSSLSGERRNRAKKNRAMPGSFRPNQLEQNSVAVSAPNLSKFCQRKFLNLNNGFNDCRIHGNPCSTKNRLFITAAEKTTLGASVIEK